jgi:hypothetical protein
MILLSKICNFILDKSIQRTGQKEREEGKEMKKKKEEESETLQK